MSEVEKHKKTNLLDEIEKQEEMCVLFYANWCSFSRRFLPIFEEYSKTKPTSCLSIVVDDKPDLCQKYEIKYYPTVILFRKGKIQKRLDSEPGIGLNKKQFEEFTKK